MLVTVFNSALRNPDGAEAANPVTEASRTLAHGVGVSMGAAAVFVAVALLIAVAFIRLPRPDRAAAG